MILNGVNVLVTRPQHQAQTLCDLIQQQGGTTLLLPTLDIIPLSINPNNLPKQIDKAIFISANAVNYGLHYLTTLKPTQLIAIGKKTAQVLTNKVKQPIFTTPAPYNSETLLQQPELQNILGQHIVIFRGQGGRDLLADTLRQRGANVSYIDVYQRQKPTTDTTWLEQETIDIVIVTSGESLQNLFSMLKQQSWLKTTPLVTMSQRVTHLARQHTQAAIYTASVASDEGLLAALLQWKQPVQG
ncbi:uroporphyrinogen-III synthase [Candidatus Albibeggiatoa sp. nov. BB20]|uniref:uroporphyrinogen-III synthase n=1 Tax=Candidatus Albibeggiatoa sp. nov. BB20 TaxID=3162723 RepID=UPI003365AC58